MSDPETLIHIYRRGDGKTVTSINSSGLRYEHFGLIVCDLVRHVAAAFKVSEDEVWEWVDREHSHPTTTITEVKPS